MLIGQSILMVLRALLDLQAQQVLQVLHLQWLALLAPQVLLAQA
jgi:hypothetical protein